MSQLKLFKKGEFLFREGDKIPQVYLISSGLVSVCVQREKQNIELYRIGTGQVIGEDALTPNAPSPFAYVALNETKVLEAPIDMIKQQVESSSQLVKLFIKGVVEKNRSTSNELKAIKMESDSAPCAPDHVAKVFGVIYHTANRVGVKKDNKVTVPWQAFKKYAQRVFLESPVRLEQAMYLLTKLKLAEKQMEKSETDPTAPEELAAFHLLDLSTVEQFFDYYQNYHYKPGYANFLKYDDKCMLTAQALLKVAENEKVDHKGAVNLSFKPTMDKMKEIFGASFNIDAIDRLQQKGLFVKRQSSEKGGTISFLKADFDVTIKAWRVLKEIDKWNELGYVDMSEPKPQAKGADQVVATISCPSCKAEVAENQKFCGECGHKMVQAAA
jgi:CRP-like cAMP-binding protein